MVPTNSKGVTLVAYRKAMRCRALTRSGRAAATFWTCANQWLRWSGPTQVHPNPEIRCICGTFLLLEATVHRAMTIGSYYLCHLSLSSPAAYPQEVLLGFAQEWVAAAMSFSPNMFGPQVFYPQASSTIPSSRTAPKKSSIPALLTWGIEISTGIETARMHAEFVFLTRPEFFGRTGCGWQSFLKNS